MKRVNEEKEELVNFSFSAAMYTQVVSFFSNEILRMMTFTVQRKPLHQKWSIPGKSGGFLTL